MGNEGQAALADYIATVRRRKWLIVLAVVVAVALAAAFASQQTTLYRATAQVLLNSDSGLVSGAGRAQADAQARYDSSQALIAHTPAVAARALAIAGHPAGVTPEGLVGMSSVSSDPNSDVLNFAVTGGNAKLAVSLVNSDIQAYSAFISDQQTRRIRAAIANDQQQINTLSDQLAQARAAGSPTGVLRAQIHGDEGQLSRDQQDLNSVQASGGVEIARRASSASQTQPNLKKDLAVALIVGLVAGLGLAYLREALDTRVRSSDEIADGLGLRLMARIPRPPKNLADGHELVMLADAEGKYAEPYRKLLVAMDFANVDLHARSVMITSAIEQEGKSTTIANLAVALARAGRHVILVDLDLRRSSVDRFFGLQGRPGITEVTLGHVTLDDALAPIGLAKDEGRPAADAGNGDAKLAGLLHVLPAGQLVPDPAEFMGTAALRAVLTELEERADILLIDSPPLVPVADAVILANRANAMIVVAQAELLRRPLLGETRRLLESCSAAKFGFVMTAAEAEAGYGYSYGGYSGGGREPSVAAGGASPGASPDR